MENFINHKSLVDQIVQGLEKEILEGTLTPGQRIIEAAICKRLRISRSPVREAFRILESEGFVVREARKGVSVVGLSLQEAEDIYRIRANLESLAAYLAVEKQSPEVLKKLKKLHIQMTEVAAAGNVEAYSNLNLEFHDILINACENRRLIQLIKTFSKQTMRYRLEGRSVPGWMNSSLKIHEAIIQSFESGDAEEAERLRKNAILSHIQRFTRKSRRGKKGEN
ncbi:MAG: FCD domain-containing protein [Proteobacteria bacterium]|nr:FCD domain-containing protein [Pseudomonadota bacterium]